jgi:hypothetical protein
MESGTLAQFIRFLQEELAIPPRSIDLALQHSDQSPSLLPMVLWQYGLVTLMQVTQMWDWLEQSTPALQTANLL